MSAVLAAVLLLRATMQSQYRSSQPLASCLTVIRKPPERGFTTPPITGIHVTTATREERNVALVLDALGLLFNKKDFAKAADVTGGEARIVTA